MFISVTSDLNDMRNRVLASVLVLPLLLVATMSVSASASTMGLTNEIVGNNEMRIYVLSVEEENGSEPEKRIDVEVVLKNLGPEPRAFNIFFAKVIASDGSEYKAVPLVSTIMPIRIPPNDILRGVLVFLIPSNLHATTLVWEEPDDTRLDIDLTQAKSPSDNKPPSEWFLSSNKGRILSDGRTQLTVHDELLDRSPGSTYYIVDVSLKNLAGETISYNIAYSFVKDQDGVIYPADFRNFGLLKNPLKEGRLATGQEIRGQILFLLPDTVTNVMFIYDEKLGLGSYFAVPEFPLLAPMIVAVSLVLVLLVHIFENRVRFDRNLD
jgi:hypothetical protein